MSEDVWLETEIGMQQATAGGAAHVLQSVAETLKEAPDGRRYDVRLTVEERSR